LAASSNNTSPAKNSREEEEQLTKILYGVDTIISTVLQFLNQTNNILDACMDYSTSSLTIDIVVLKEAFLNAKERGVKLRYVTEITNDNISYCKQLLTMVDELRHLDGIKGNLYLGDTAYIAPATFHEKGASLIYSNVKEIIGHQRYLFETLWNKAIPAEQRINEIEKGVTLGKTEVIQNPQTTQKLFINMVKSAKHEILLLLPTVNAFLRKERLGIIQLLKQAATEDGVNVRILSPTNNEIENKLKDITAIEDKERGEKKRRDFNLRSIHTQFEEFAVNTVTIVVIDKKESLVFEKVDDSKENFIEAVGLATYSNSKPTVLSYISIFESLWRQVQLYEQLKVHDKMQKEFINIAAHELRTPTQAITGYSELLEMEPENTRIYLNPIIRNSKRLQRLSEDILDLTRIESQSLKLTKEEFDLNDVISSIVGDYRSLLIDDEDNINLNIVYEPKSIILNADKERIAQVISNLLSNAIKFTTKENGTIYVSADKNGSQVIVSVKDTGQGIDSEILPRLFTKFATKSSMGTGLGLFISKSIVEAHGGKIWAENNSKGAIFSFSIPKN
jgi:signal transduction histidine kinase